MNKNLVDKIKPSHLGKIAYLYVRQSTVRQVFENSESTERQYALRQRAINLGWSEDQVVVIDSDLGQSGSGAVKREGFQKLVTEVGMGRAGIVLGLEVSRLARNSVDWHRLVEFCALTDTLILDEDGVYDPSQFNDRLLLGLKGTMSEAELHVLHSRLRGGLLNKARRGELRLFLPIGFVYDNMEKIALDPDQQIQETIRLFFKTYERTGSVYATTKYFRDEGILFPAYARSGISKGQLEWRPLSLNRTSHLLHNPIYAGAYVYGRSINRKKPDGRTKHSLLPRGEWKVLIKDLHPGYISWESFELNERSLGIALAASGADKKMAAREGPALLQGRAICGLCGSRMHVRYNKKGTRRITNYVCWARGRGYGDPMCQSILGIEIDRTISELVLKTVNPMALEATLAVQEEVVQRIKESDAIRHRQVQRAQYEADSAKHRYMHVDPTNRLVAESLEAEWNEKLRKLIAIKEENQRQRKTDNLTISENQKEKILQLATDFPSLWNEVNTPNRERKKMLGLLIEDVTLIKAKQITMSIRFRGGACQILTIPRPLTYNQMRVTNAEVRQMISTLLDEYTDSRIAQTLNERGMVTGAGEVFDHQSVKWIRHTNKLRSLKQRLIENGWVSNREMCKLLNSSRDKINKKRIEGELNARLCNDNGEWLYWPPGRGVQSTEIEFSQLNTPTGQGAL